MANGMDDRRRGLEEDYFRKKDQEAIEKLREKMKVAEEAKAAGISSMKCPRCDGSLKESKFEEVTDRHLRQMRWHVARLWRA